MPNVAGKIGPTSQGLQEVVCELVLANDTRMIENFHALIFCLSPWCLKPSSTAKRTSCHVFFSNW